MAFPFMKKSLCMGCFVEFGLAQKLDIDVHHYMNCSHEHCFDCEYAFMKALWALDYNWHKPKWVTGTGARQTRKLFGFMMIYLPTYQLPREVKTSVSCKVLILLNKFNLLTELTIYLGKLIMACKSLILLLLTNLPNFPL